MHTLYREMRLDGARQGAADATVFDAAVSSDVPYERWWGIEVLSHAEGAVNMERINDGANVLFNHNWNDLRGVIEPGSARTAEGKLRAKLRLTQASEKGREAAALINDGVLTKISVGYSIDEIIEKSTSKDGRELSRTIPPDVFAVTRRSFGEQLGDRAAFYRALDSKFGAFERAGDAPSTFIATRWTPHEISLVTVPADITVGIGRSHQPVPPTPAQPATLSKEQSMDPQAVQHAQAGAAADIQVIDNESGKRLEKARSAALMKLGDEYQIPSAQVRQWIESDISLKAACDEALAILAKRQETAQPVSHLGFGRKEIQGYSLLRAIEACASGNWDRAGLEAEAHKAIASRVKSQPDPKKFFVPMEIQERGGHYRHPAMDAMNPGILLNGKRDMTVATAAQGGYLVETTNMSFIEMLRNRSVAMRMGATRLSGLSGNVTIPKQTAAGTAAWLSTEATAITESQQTLAQLALVPKTVGAYTEISRLLLLQSSPGAEAIVTNDLAAIVGLAVDLAALEGSGAAGQPTGIANTAGIGSVTGTSLGYAGIIEFQTDVAAGNVQPARGGYVTTPAVAGLLKARQRFTSTDTPIWQGNIWDGAIEGFPAMSSNQLTAATMIFGDWSAVVIGEWGVLEIEVNPYANFQAGIMGVRAMYTVDVGVRYPIAFSRATTIT